MEPVVIVLRALTGVVVLDTVLCFFAPRCGLRAFTNRLTAPLYRPVHRICDPQRLGADFAPMVVAMSLVALGFLLAPELVSHP